MNFHISTETRRAYSAHFIRAHMQGFRPLSLAQFAHFELFTIRGFSL